LTDRGCADTFGPVKSVSASASPEIIIVFTTVGTQEQALDIAHALVHRRLAACVNILPNVRSIFRWKGKIHDDGEFMLMVKTIPTRYLAVKKAIREMHTYELPEILGHSVARAEPRFVEWIDEMSRPVKRAPRGPRKKAPPKKA
jgi:periplasmic divalent cation tolerance protein